MSENPLFSSIGSLVHELRGSITYILGVYAALDHKLPDPAQKSWNDLGIISKRVLVEIEEHLGAILTNIDFY